MDKAASTQDNTLAEPDAQARKGVADALAQLSQGKANDPAALARAEVLGRIIRAGDRMQRQRQNQSPIYLLLALAKGQATAPGRKTVIYFTTGFEVPNLLDDVFKGAMSEANRARVAFYAVDVRGLDTTRQGESARSRHRRGRGGEPRPGPDDLRARSRRARRRSPTAPRRAPGPTRSSR